MTQQLRRLSMKWPPRNRVKIAGRREYYRIKADGTPYKSPNYEYPCSKCKGWFPDKHVQMDHVHPVVNPKDSNLYTEEEFIGKFAVSLLAYEDGWQVLCTKCHDEKTRKENEERLNSKKA